MCGKPISSINGSPLYKLIFSESTSKINVYWGTATPENVLLRLLHSHNAQLGHSFLNMASLAPCWWFEDRNEKSQIDYGMLSGDTDESLVIIVTVQMRN